MFGKRWLVMVFVFVTSLAAVAQAATLHGTIYEWSDFEKPLKNVIVEIGENSTRVQYKISTTGEYNFTLSPGNYSIKAKYYRNNILELTGEENIRIEKAYESREFDLLLFPPTEPEYEYLGDINLTREMDIKSEYDINYHMTILILALSAIVIFYLFKKKKNKANKTITKEPYPQPPEKIIEKPGELPEDLNEIYELILKKGGRITQKELRKEVKYGEAKVSLMLDDLEERGLIKKIKKGRANIIIADVKK